MCVSGCCLSHLGLFRTGKPDENVLFGLNPLLGLVFGARKGEKETTKVQMRVEIKKIAKKKNGVEKLVTMKSPFSMTKSRVCGKEPETLDSAGRSADAADPFSRALSTSVNVSQGTRVTAVLPAIARTATSLNECAWPWIAT